MSPQFEKFRDTLQQVFMLNQADLDFGIYRIMNQRRADIEKYLNEDLVNQVKEVVDAGSATKRVQLTTELEEAKKAAQSLGVDPEQLPKVKSICAELESLGSSSDLENQVYDHLATFFKRYYEGGDFVTQRRYKKDTYAIPYQGEDVKLYWANTDQYYIKTSEYFRTYSFRLTDGKLVEFVLVEASTEQSNNKTQGKQERLFALLDENPVEVVDGNLHINFTYELHPRTIKQTELIKKAYDTVRTLIPAEFAGVFALFPSEKDRNRTLLQKHLNDYVARNTFDYFIHKDLEGFLVRELDFYIKNEIVNIDDLDTADARSRNFFSVIKAVKSVGHKIIHFLASLENYQRRLWLKKKFIYESNYCITLDRVPVELYPQICANDAQREEWVRLFAIDKIKASSGDLMTGPIEGFSTPLTKEFLLQNKYIVLDTAFFDDAFKHTLLSSFSNLDDQTDGVLISSENFQALNLLQEKYRGAIKCIYADPPYNTSASEIAYKNSYRDSSWLSLMDDRLKLGRNLLTDDGIQCTTIDDVEESKLSLLLEDVFGRQPECVTIRVKPSGRPIPNGFAISHEYGLFSKKSDGTSIQRLPHSDEQNARYRETDEKGVFLWELLRKAGSNSSREDRPTMFYPIFLNEKTGKLRMPKLEYDDALEEYKLLEKTKEGEIALYPIRDDGTEGNWYYGVDSSTREVDEFKAVKQANGQYFVYRRRRPNEGVQPTTFWDESKYSATEHGTALLKKIFGKQQTFSYPKSIFAVEDCLKVSGVEEGSTVLDYFGGSATTGHAVINLNRQADSYTRKFILVEMADYFDTVTKPRIEKVIYSKDWNKGMPVSRDGSSCCIKYIRLEGYEDTLNNMVLKRNDEFSFGEESSFRESYLLGYMLDTETRDSLFSAKWFAHPFDVSLKITRHNEIQEKKIDLVDTFNFLLGLYVESISWPKDGLCVVIGRTRRGEKNLILWRDIKKVSNDDLNAFFVENLATIAEDASRIYVNGDSNLGVTKDASSMWQLELTEAEFSKRMFEE